MNEEMTTDQGLVTGRRSEALPAFCAKIVEEFAKGQHAYSVETGRICSPNLPKNRLRR